MYFASLSVSSILARKIDRIEALAVPTNTVVEEMEKDKRTRYEVLKFSEESKPWVSSTFERFYILTN